MTLLDRALRIGGAGAARRSGVVAIVYGVHATFALALAWPIASLVADPVLGHPRGDRVLFEPGGLFLTEAIRIMRAPLESVAEGMSFGILVGLYLGLLPLGALLHALGTEEKLSAGALATAAGRFLGSLSLLLGCSLVVGGVACALPLVIRGLLETKIRSAFGDRGGDLVGVGFHLIALGVAWLVGVVHDLARAALVARGLSALQAAQAATEALRAFPAEALGGWALRALSALLLVTIAARATTHIGVDTMPRLTVVALMHQAVAITLVFLRADWLALAMRLVGWSYRRDL